MQINIDPVEAVERALACNPDYVKDCLAKYMLRNEQRQSQSIPVVMICGHGGAGKDFAAAYLCAKTLLEYGGSTSRTVAPLVTAGVNRPAGDVNSVFKERRDNRQFWYEFCNEVRRTDPTLLAKMNLAEGDVVVGPRDGFEVREIVSQKIVDLTVWIENTRVEVDPTVTFGPEDCDITITNNGGRFALYSKIDKLIDLLQTQYRLK